MEGVWCEVCWAIVPYDKAREHAHFGGDLDEGLFCPYCGRGPFASAEDREGHEGYCDKNPLVVPT